ncbi:unnamed protein product [Prunus brigantina]
MTACLFLNLPLSSSSAAFTYHTNKNYPSLASHLLLTLTPNQSLEEAIKSISILSSRIIPHQNLTDYRLRDEPKCSLVVKFDLV